MTSYHDSERRQQWMRNTQLVLPSEAVAQRLQSSSLRPPLPFSSSSSHSSSSLTLSTAATLTTSIATSSLQYSPISSIAFSSSSDSFSPWQHRVRRRSLLHRAFLLFTAALFLLFATLTTSPLLFVTSASCVTPPSNATLPLPSVINIAILFWGPTSITNTTKIVYPESPILSGWSGPSSVEKLVLQTYLLYTERLPPQGIPIDDDRGNIQLNYTYFNAGSWTDIAGKGNNEFSDAYQKGWLHTLVTELANPQGKYGRYTFIISPNQASTQAAIVVSNACETTKSCIVLGAIYPESRCLMCGYFNSSELQPDCVQRNRKEGDRRFEYTLSSYIDPDYIGGGSLSLYAAKGFKRAFVFAEPWTENAVNGSIGIAKMYGINIVGVEYAAASHPVDPSAPTSTSPIGGAGDGWATGASSAQMTQMLIDQEVEVILFFGAFPTKAFLDLFLYWQQVDYTPLSASYLYGGQVWFAPSLISYMLTEVPWMPWLSGAAYRSRITPFNYEVFPSNKTHDSPAVFTDAYVERWKGAPILGGPVASWSLPILAVHTIIVAQKLIEKVATDDIETLRIASMAISVPSVLHTVAFDSYGRSLTYDAYVVQQMPPASATSSPGERVLTPLGLGADPILPMPTWSEREFHPTFYSTTREQLMLAFTCATLVYLISWFVWGVCNFNHNIIRASAPAFSGAVLIGCMLMVSSNFFSTVYLTPTHCSLSTWTLSLGFSLTFSALTIKNFRIYWIILKFRNLMVSAKITFTTMALLVSCVLLTDIIINTTWEVMLGGMKTILKVPDENRISLSYYVCDYSSAKYFIYAHLIVKGILLLCAMLLAWNLRRVSSQFNESIYIAFATYNCCMVCCLVIPLLYYNIGERDSNYLIRAYTLIFLSLSSASILCIPKAMKIYTPPPMNQMNRQIHANMMISQHDHEREGREREKMILTMGEKELDELAARGGIGGGGPTAEQHHQGAGIEMTERRRTGQHDRRDRHRHRHQRDAHGTTVTNNLHHDHQQPQHRQQHQRQIQQQQHSQQQQQQSQQYNPYLNYSGLHPSSIYLSSSTHTGGPPTSTGSNTHSNGSVPSNVAGGIQSSTQSPRPSPLSNSRSFLARAASASLGASSGGSGVQLAGVMSSDTSIVRRGDEAMRVAYEIMDGDDEVDEVQVRQLHAALTRRIQRQATASSLEMIAAPHPSVVSHYTSSHSSSSSGGGGSSLASLSSNTGGQVSSSLTPTSQYRASSQRRAFVFDNQQETPPSVGMNGAALMIPPVSVPAAIATMQQPPQSQLQQQQPSSRPPSQQPSQHSTPQTVPPLAHIHPSLPQLHLQTQLQTQLQTGLIGGGLMYKQTPSPRHSMRHVRDLIPTLVAQGEAIQPASMSAPTSASHSASSSSHSSQPPSSVHSPIVSPRSLLEHTNYSSYTTQSTSPHVRTRNVGFLQMMRAEQQLLLLQQLQQQQDQQKQLAQQTSETIAAPSSSSSPFTPAPLSLIASPSAPLTSPSPLSSPTSASGVEIVTPE